MLGSVAVPHSRPCAELYLLLDDVIVEHTAFGLPLEVYSLRDAALRCLVATCIDTHLCEQDWSRCSTVPRPLGHWQQPFCRSEGTNDCAKEAHRPACLAIPVKIDARCLPWAQGGISEQRWHTPARV